jgi:hypothetical protein
MNHLSTRQRINASLSNACVAHQCTTQQRISSSMNHHQCINTSTPKCKRDAKARILRWSVDSPLFKSHDFIMSIKHVKYSCLITIFTWGIRWCPFGREVAAVESWTWRFSATVTVAESRQVKNSSTSTTFHLLHGCEAGGYRGSLISVTTVRTMAKGPACASWFCLPSL